MSVLHGLLLAPTVEYKNYTQLMWIGNLVSVVVALAVFFVFFFISRKVRRDELAEEKRLSDAEKENREDREAAATPTRESQISLLNPRRMAMPCPQRCFVRSITLSPVCSPLHRA